MKKIIYKDQLERETLACPYCMREVSFNMLGCCGESRGHFTKAYIDTNFEMYLENEVELRLDEEEERDLSDFWKRDDRTDNNR